MKKVHGSKKFTKFNIVQENWKSSSIFIKVHKFEKVHGSKKFMKFNIVQENWKKFIDFHKSSRILKKFIDLDKKFIGFWKEFIDFDKSSSN